MHNNRVIRASRFPMDRLISISDGIFAVGLTLLIVDVRPPAVDAARLGSALLLTLPRLGIFCLSFAIVAYYWVVHHLIFEYVREADRSLLWLNLAFLLTVVTLPFSAGVLGDHPLSAAALTLFGTNIACCSIVLGIVWQYATHADLIRRPTKAQHRYIVFRFALSPIVALSGVAIAYASPMISLCVLFLLPLSYALTSAERRSSGRSAR